MTVAQLDDKERLQALEVSGLLRKDVAARYDHLVYSASILLNADLAELNILTDDWQYHVSTWPPSGITRGPVQEAGCKVVVTEERTVQVEDVRTHPVMCTMPWTKSMRGYLGTPVYYEGHCIGSLCVLTVEPRSWARMDLAAIEGLARLAGLAPA